ncbi:hypothetical protein [Mycolicibacterium neoaurum]|nr:hypothetical protein [Mycolicibacterium neoaurum]
MTIGQGSARVYVPADAVPALLDAIRKASGYYERVSPPIRRYVKAVPS